MTAQTLPGYVISSEGEIQFPYVGLFKAEGYTEVEAQKKLRELLSEYIRDPQITLRVIGYRSQKIYVDGEVRAAGVKQMTDVPMTLSEALNQAGGIPASGDASRITLVRGARNYEISVPALIARNISPSNIALQNGDVLRVAPLSDNQVMVDGEVRSPGSLSLRSNGSLSLSEALSGAGGVDATTSDPGAIYVVRAAADGGMPKVFHLNSKSPIGMALAENFPLQAKDLVYVDAPGLVRFSRVMAHLIGSATIASDTRNAASKRN
jgi:polysaccharide export outer membrane protein